MQIHELTETKINEVDLVGPGSIFRRAKTAAQVATQPGGAAALGKSMISSQPGDYETRKRDLELKQRAAQRAAQLAQQPARPTTAPAPAVAVGSFSDPRAEALAKAAGIRPDNLRALAQHLQSNQEAVTVSSTGSASLDALLKSVGLI